MMQMDLSTINMDELNKLPLFNCPEDSHVSKLLGSGCAGDPPGFPTYFIQSVYDQRGNTPERGATAVIQGRMVDWECEYLSWNDRRKMFNDRMFRLWKPLPIDHPRTRAWIISTHRHFHHCYVDDTLPVTDRNRMVIYPVPEYKLKSFVDDKRFNDEWRTVEKERIRLENEFTIKAAELIAMPRNHMATRTIQKFYPDHVPNLDLIENPGRGVEKWWETLPRKPTPDKCPGESRWSDNPKHPVNGTWCQVCGWHKTG